LSFDLIVLEEPGNIRIKIYGQKTTDTMNLIWKQIVSESHRSAAKPVLVEDYMEGSISPATSFRSREWCGRWACPGPFR